MLEVDPPSYVVKVAYKIGFTKPFDRRWAWLYQIPGFEQSRPFLDIICLFCTIRPAHLHQFSCANHTLQLVSLHKEGFTFENKKVSVYWIGQCPVCETCYWLKGQPIVHPGYKQWLWQKSINRAIARTKQSIR